MTATAPDANALLGMEPCPSPPANNPLLHWAGRYRTVLEARGRSPRHVHQVHRHVRELIVSMNASAPEHLSEDAIMGALLALKKRGRSLRTLNSFLRDLKSFFRWCCRRSVGLLPYNPADEIPMYPEKKDRRLVRVPFTEAQLALILQTAEKSPRDWHGITGAERAEAYHAMAATGVRVGTLRVLEAGQFEVSPEAKEPLLRIRADQIKDGQDLEIPILATSAARLRRYLSSKHPRAKAFRLPREWQCIRMLRRDLRAAGIPLFERVTLADGKTRRKESVLGLHSFRMTFGVRNLRAGVPLPTVQKWMGHSTPDLTSNLYNFVSRADGAAELAKVPPIPGV